MITTIDVIVTFHVSSWQESVIVSGEAFLRLTQKSAFSSFYASNSTKFQSHLQWNSYLPSKIYYSWLHCVKIRFFLEKADLKTKLDIEVVYWLVLVYYISILILVYWLELVYWL